jgi:hypothetical protein
MTRKKRGSPSAHARSASRMRTTPSWATRRPDSASRSNRATKPERRARWGWKTLRATLEARAPREVGVEDLEGDAAPRRALPDFLREEDRSRGAGADLLDQHVAAQPVAGVHGRPPTRGGVVVAADLRARPT